MDGFAVMILKNIHLEIINPIPQNFKEWFRNSCCYCSVLIIVKSLVFCLSYSRQQGQSLPRTNGLSSGQSHGAPAPLLSFCQLHSTKAYAAEVPTALDRDRNLREMLLLPSHARHFISTTFSSILPQFPWWSIHFCLVIITKSLPMPFLWLAYFPVIVRWLCTSPLVIIIIIPTHRWRNWDSQR